MRAPASATICALGILQNSCIALQPELMFTIEFFLTMPEPVSIAAAVVSIVASSIKGLEIAVSYASKFNLADVKILVLRGSCKALQEALIRISNLLSTESLHFVLQGTSDESQASFQRFEDIFGSCSITFNILHEKLLPLLSPTFNAEGTVAKRSKVAAVWNDSTLMVMNDLVRTEMEAVQLLFAALTANSIFETHRILTSQNAATVFQRVDNDTRSLFTSHQEQSITQQTRDGAESVLGDEEYPEIDDILVNSKVYRRVLEVNLRRAGQSISGPSQAQRSHEADASYTNQNRQRNTPRLTSSGNPMLHSLLRSRRPQQPGVARRPRSVVDVPNREGAQPIRSTSPSSVVTLQIAATPRSADDRWDEFESLLKASEKTITKPRISADHMSELLDEQTLEIEKLLIENKRKKKM
ncbi:uncharacterized protein M421DRAFT_282450 [Didymella exigua CBS 183.55]|uniref:Fungal N-terminal domain-containing protein n=1 Tax=Didymella exigua CBS 183.55 TaxID=1150837 RepID=A0A6A5S3E4_9PLEO|nr:uncharacterized protein M421DRAFT_282450 [Didymella exigua CBS 183.55]KAF1932007.1 hypothetical protein M421DRAFT_282450 [Didymella exigua CBS 183.55]